MKLTKPQYLLLVDVSEGNGHVFNTYPPAKKLVELGLCEWKSHRYTSYLDITDAGRQALAAQEDGK